mgnify:FL=1|tara:strand:- start:825 stop:1139 length:315 start_codon:yes stop_codon:yes gene_type:complete
MTRHLEGKPLPRFVLTPDNRNMGIEPRHAPVYGISVIPECLNPSCKREGPMDALMLGPLDRWPNVAVVCGDEGCGVFWGLISAPPIQTMWLQVDEGGDDDEESE